MDEARAAKYQGTVLLYVEIGPSGKATNIKVQRDRGLGLDGKAVEAVEKWKFQTGTKGWCGSNGHGNHPVELSAVIVCRRQLCDASCGTDTAIHEQRRFKT